MMYGVGVVAQTEMVRLMIEKGAESFTFAKVLS